MTPYYESGGITIYHGDCREILPTLPVNSVRLVWTDPPYGLSFNDGGDLAHRREHALGQRSPGPCDARPIAGDKPEDYETLITGVLPELARICCNDCCCCCCCGGGGPRPMFAEMALWMDRRPWQFFHAVVWRKAGLGMGWRYRRDYEFVMVSHKASGNLAWYYDGHDISNVIDGRRILPQAHEHPTPKPVELIQHFVMLHSQPGDIVLDPFMGHGPSLVAAKLSGRRAIGIELDESYCEAAALRLSQGTLDLCGPVAATDTDMRVASIGLLGSTVDRVAGFDGGNQGRLFGDDATYE